MCPRHATKSKPSTDILKLKVSNIRSLSGSSPKVLLDTLYVYIYIYKALCILGVCLCVTFLILIEEVITELGILGSWDVGMLGFWDLGILGFWDFRILVFRDPKKKSNYIKLHVS